MHVGRTLTFRAGGGSVTFDIVLVRGMPQGAPAPAVYVCLVEEFSLLAAAALEILDIPAGLPVPDPEDERTPFDVDQLQPRVRLHRPAVYSCNFADDTYLLAASAIQISCMVTTVALPLSAAHQFLATEKTAVLADPSTDARMRFGERKKMQGYLDTGRRPPERGPGDLGPRSLSLSWK